MALAAASITGVEPMRTGVTAVRVGIVMFTIPFTFAWYPELLLIPEAVTITDASGAKALIDGYSGEVDIAALSALSARLILALYLVASALARYDRGPRGGVEIATLLVCPSFSRAAHHIWGDAQTLNDTLLLLAASAARGAH